MGRWLASCLALTLIASEALAADFNPYQAGRKALSRGDARSALEKFDEALQANLQPYDSHLGRSEAFYLLKDYANATAECDLAARLRPGESAAHRLKGGVLMKTRDFRGVAIALRRAVEVEPGRADLQNDLSWLLATCPDADVRDGARALAAGKEATRLSQRKNPFCLDTLAAAHAECGQFDDAVREQQAALEIVYKARGNPGFSISQMQSRLKLYRRKQPYREK